MKDDLITNIIDLSDTWTLRECENKTCYAIKLPRNGITALERAGAIPDPYWGRNEYDLRWICERDWRMARDFVLTRCDVDLVLAEVDTVAEVRVNGALVLKTDNAFRTYRVDLSDVAKIGENQIEIVFKSSVAAGQALQDAAPFLLPNSKNCPIPNGNMLRKPACDFGWDWNIALAPFGIYGDMCIAPRQAVRIASARVTVGRQGGHMTVLADYEIEGDAPEIQATLDTQTIKAPVVNGLAQVNFTIKDPKLWWPAGQGEQPLYDLVATCGDARDIRRIGLREIEHVTEDGGFKFRVNGRDIYAKGANWIPADALPGRITPAKTRDLLQSAVDANMNMIRIWGGGRYEPDWFYDLCDELGIMIWQDFMFACNLYPSDDAYLAEVDAEVREVVRRLNHHPCIALWCGDNELIGALGWYDCSRDNRDRYLVSYDRLNRTIESALKATLPDANWWPSSPASGRLDFGDAWHDDSQGDMHFWSVWHEGRDFEHYRDVSPRFCSEFGFQSFPSMDVIKSFAGPEDWNISSRVMDSHQKNVAGNARITETMFRYFRFPNTFEDFVYLSQVQQGFAIKTAVDHWSGLKPHNMGALYWQLNDTWPVASWASLDYGGGWKVLHHMARRFFDPCRVLVRPTDAGFVFHAVNDGASATDITCTIYALSLDGSLRTLDEASVQIPQDKSVEVLSLAAADLGADELLYWQWRQPGGMTQDDHFAPRPYKAYDLPAPNLKLTRVQRGSDWQIELNSDALALYVSVECDQPGRLTDNAVLVRPGAPKTLTFTPTEPSVTPNFTLRDLHSATY